MAWDLGPSRPFEEFDKISEEMDRLWDTFLFGVPRATRAEKEEGWAFPVDMTETETDFIVQADMPGLEPGDLDTSLSERLLTIQGEKKQKEDEKEQSYHLHERNHGIFARFVHLPKDVESAKITASFKDGVLRIVLPKSPEAMGHEIKIKVE